MPMRYAQVLTAIAVLSVGVGCGSDDSAAGSGGSAGTGATAGSAGTGATAGSGGSAGTGATAGSAGTGGTGGSPPLPACTQYVAKSGSVNGQSAATSIQAGIDTLVPGAVLCVAPGSYHETVTIKTDGTAAQPITIRALDPANKPVIDGQYELPAGEPTNAFRPYYGNTNCSEFWEDPKANEGPAPKQACWKWEYMVRIAKSHIVWDGIDVTRARGLGVLLGNYDGPASAVQSVQFRNSELSHIRNEGVYIAGIKGAIFRGNIVRDTNDFAAYGRRAPKIVWVDGKPNWTGDGPGWSGAIYQRFSEDVELIDNVIFHNWGEGMVTGLFFANTLNTHIEGNVIYDNMSVQLIPANGNNVTMVRNIIYHTGDPKYYLNVPGWTGCISFSNEDKSQTENVLFANNIVAGCAGLLFFGQFTPEAKITNIRVYNNTLFTNDNVFHTGSSSLNHSGLSFVNNIALGKVNMVMFPGMDFHHNVWSSAPPSYMQGPGDIITSTPGLAMPGYKPPAGAFDTASIELLPSSPAVNGGTKVSEVTTDFFGTLRPVGAAFDIGAYELK